MSIRYVIALVFLAFMFVGCQGSEAKKAIQEVATCCVGKEPRSCMDTQLPVMERQAQFLGRGYYRQNETFQKAVDDASGGGKVEEFNFCGPKLSQVKAALGAD